MSEESKTIKPLNNCIPLIHGYSFTSYIHKIMPYLYLSDFECSEYAPFFAPRNIVAVCTISLRTHSKPALEFYKQNNISVYQWKVDDETKVDIIKVAKRIHKIIEKTRNHNKGHSGDQAILVHCDAGISRSVSCIIYHLMKSWKFLFNEAYRYVRNIRPFVQPNEGFRNQLKSLKMNEPEKEWEEYLTKMPNLYNYVNKLRTNGIKRKYQPIINTPAKVYTDNSIKNLKLKCQLKL